MAQLAQRVLPTPEVRGSNPDIGEFYVEYLFTYCQLYFKDENNEKEAVNGPFLVQHQMPVKVNN